MTSLSAFEKKLLAVLDCDSRASISHLAKSLRVSRDKVSYHLEKFVSEGVIDEFTATVNVASFGYTVYKTYLRLVNDPDKIESAIQFLEQHEGVYWVARSSGHWNVMFSIASRTPQEFYKFQNKAFSKFSSLIIDFDVFTLINCQFYPRTYLAPVKSDSFQQMGGDQGDYELDSVEYQIIREVCHNARASVPVLAEKVGVTPAIVRYRLEQLERAGIVSGYRLQLNRDVLGVLFSKVQLSFMSYRRLSEVALLDFCAKHPNIPFFIEQLGSSKIELQLETENYGQLAAILDELTSKFRNHIKHAETSLLGEEHFNWMPRLRVFE